MTTTRRLFLAALSSLTVSTAAIAQDILPTDHTDSDYHPSPRYRESESHPLRVIAYALHPIGWAARELIFRPLSYFASSTPETRAIMGYREPYDFRKPSCFSSNQDTPDCRQIKPFDYDSNVGKVVQGDGEVSQQQALYFPDTNFDFDKRSLNAAGKEKARVAAEILKREGYLKVVLEGHADSRGSEKYNERLGLGRAEAVKAELVSQGIPVDTLSTISFGETRPLFTEKEEWAYSANRRVHVRLDDERAAKAAAVAPLQPHMPAAAPVEAAAPAKAEAPKAAAKPKKKAYAKAAKKAEPAVAAVPAAAPEAPAPVAPPAEASAPAAQK
jgi:outer membrane protein OmpA-like peptidoglycan-associated protein